MTRIKAGQARDHFGATLRRIETKGDRIIVQRRGKDVAAMISIDELRRMDSLLEELQDRLDAKEAEKILAEMTAKGEKPVPYERIRKELGLS